MEENSNQVFAPNTTQIPNVFLDYWMGVLSHPQFKILMAIARKTFGWHKKKDKISKKQIREATGLSNDSIKKGVKELIKHGLVAKTETFTEFGDNDANLYEIHVVFQKQNKDLGGTQNNPGVGREKAQGGTQNSPTKETRTKDTYTKGTCTGTMPSFGFDVEYMCKRWGLTDQQRDTLTFLASVVGLGTKPEVLTWWAKKYSFERIVEVYRYAKEKSKGSLGAYMHKILENGIVINDKNRLENLEMTKLFQEIHGASSIKVTKKYVVVNLPSGSTQDIYLNRPPQEFKRCLENYLGSLF